MQVSSFIPDGYDRAPADRITPARAARWAVERLKAWGLDNPRQTFSIRTRMVLEAHGRDDCAALHAADRLCRGMVSSDSRSLTGAHLSATACCRYRSPRAAPAALSCSHRHRPSFSARSPGAVRRNRSVQTNPPLPGPSVLTPTFDMLTRLRTRRAGVVLSQGDGTRHGAFKAFPIRRATPFQRRSGRGTLQYVGAAGTGRRCTTAHRGRDPVYENDLNSYNVLAEIQGTDRCCAMRLSSSAPSGFQLYGEWCYR
jgi:hypothetical protein